jgi:hypothetical protein
MYLPFSLTQKVKEFTGKIDALKAAKLAAESRKEMTESPVTKIGGFQDFTAPRSRDRATSQDKPESE